MATPLRRATRRRLPRPDSGPVAGPAPSQWLNIGDDLPADLAGCERLVELVAGTDDEVAAGRRRWAGYRRQGLEPRHHDSGGDDGPPG